MKRIRQQNKFLDGNVDESTVPSLSPLHAIELDKTSRHEEQFLRRVVNIDDFAIAVFDQAVEHIKMGLSKDQKTR